MASKTYFKVKWDRCPKCRETREIVERGEAYRHSRIERRYDTLGHRCYNCGDFKRVPINKIIKRGLTNFSQRLIME